MDPRVAAAEPIVKGGPPQTGVDPLDLEGNEYGFRYISTEVNDAFRYLLTEWAGVANPDPLLVLPKSGDPLWIPALRVQVLRTMETAANHGDRTAALAQKLIDGVESNPPITKPDDARLSEGRKTMLHEGEKRMQSYEGEDKTDLFANTQKQTEGTSCGLLPGTVMSKSGVQGLIVAPGVAGMKNRRRALKVWHKAAGPGDTPIPGDPYLLTDGGSNVKHVGIIRQLDVPDAVHGLVWETMDAGQGGGQAADFVRRKVERRADGIWLHPTNGGAVAGDTADWRKLDGWVELDKLMALTAKEQNYSSSALLDKLDPKRVEKRKADEAARKAAGK